MRKGEANPEGPAVSPVSNAVSERSRDFAAAIWSFPPLSDSVKSWIDWMMSTGVCQTSKSIVGSLLATGCFKINPRTRRAAEVSHPDRVSKPVCGSAMASFVAGFSSDACFYLMLLQFEASVVEYWQQKMNGPQSSRPLLARLRTVAQDALPTSATDVAETSDYISMTAPTNGVLDDSSIPALKETSVPPATLANLDEESPLNGSAEPPTLRSMEGSPKRVTRGIKRSRVDDAGLTLEGEEGPTARMSTKDP